MLKYLENIIEMTKYKQSIEDVIKKVDFLNEVNLKKLNHVVIIEKKKDNLEIINLKNDC